MADRRHESGVGLEDVEHFGQRERGFLALYGAFPPDPVDGES